MDKSSKVNYHFSKFLEIQLCKKKKLMMEDEITLKWLTFVEYFQLLYGFFRSPI